MVLSPMLATTAATVPTGLGYVFEPKWDGMRTLLHVDRDLRVRVVSRRGHRWTRAFPELARLGPAIGRPAVLDGETIALGPDGRPDFASLARRLHVRHPAWAARTLPVTFVAFDLLALDGRLVIERPWQQRRQLLEILDLAGAPAVVTLVSEDGDALYAATGALGVEGVVAKRPGARYVCGRRTRAWVKVKHPHRGWFDLVAWRPPDRAHPAGSLVLADDDQPAGTALPALPPPLAAALRLFLDRHGARDGRLVRVPAGVQVRVEYRERSPRGHVRGAVAHDLRPALP